LSKGKLQDENFHEIDLLIKMAIQLYYLKNSGTIDLRKDLETVTNQRRLETQDSMI
jgi:hypothetical protein